MFFNVNEIGKPEEPTNIFPLERVFNEAKKEENRSYKLLGVYFDEFLSFDKHTNYICAKLSKSIFCIKRAANKLSWKSLRSLYFALVHPHLQYYMYCNNIITWSSEKYIKKLFKLQKKAIKIISKSKINDHTGPLF